MDRIKTVDTDNALGLALAMLCQKTNMQLPSEGSVEKSADSQGLPRNNAPAVAMESSEADRLNKKRQRTRDWRKRNKIRIRQYLKRYKELNPRKVKLWAKISHQRWVERNREYYLEKQRLYRLRKFGPPRIPKTEQQRKEVKRNWHLKNREKIIRQQAVRRNSDKYREMARRSARRKWEKVKGDPVRHNRLRDYYKAWTARHPNYYSDYFKTRKRNDPAFKIRCTMAGRISLALRGVRKSAPTEALLGCDFSQLVSHIEKQWLTGMNWETYGNGAGKWNVDHIKPCAAFPDLTDPSQQKDCFHYTNLKPCWHSDNVSKGSMWNGERHRYKIPKRQNETILQA